MPPVAPADAKPEAAEFKLNIPFRHGHRHPGCGVRRRFGDGLFALPVSKTYGQTIWRVRFSLLTIAAMLALGNVDLNIDDEIAAYEREQKAAASAAMAAAADTAAAEADAAEAAARAAAEMEAAEARAVAQVAEAEARAAAEAQARAAADAEARAAAEAEARAAAEAQARAAAEEQARLAAEAEEAAARRAAAEAEPAPAEPRDDLVYQPTWQIVAPEAPAPDQLPAPQQPGFPPGPSAAEPIAASAEPAMAEPAGMAATAIGRGSSVPGSTTRRERWHRGPVGRVRP